MKLTELLNPWIQNSQTDCSITGIQNDSRKIQSGDLFIAYPGSQADGRLFIEKAVSMGAAAIAYDPVNFPKDRALPKEIPCVSIPNLAEQLGEIAKGFYHNPSASIMLTGITGTNGKTTIAYQLAQANALLGQKSAYIGTIGQGEVNALKPLENTTPDALCLQSLLNHYKNSGIKQVSIEVSSHALSQHRVDSLAFNQALFTNLTLDHLDYHHTMEAYAQAKASLFARDELEWIIINQDDPHQGLMLKQVKPHVKKITYGIHQHCDVKAVRWQMGIRGTEIEIHSPWGRHQLVIKALGQFNIYNSLAVFSSLMISGYSSEKVISVMSQLVAAPGRMEIVAKKPYVLVDYAHTPDALENVLCTLKELKKGQLWVVFGCGGDRDKTKRPVMGKIASLHADKVIITSDNPRTENPELIMKDIASGVINSSVVKQLGDREAAIAYALDQAEGNDIVLIAGKGHESYQQIGKIKHAFSDQEVIRRLRAHRSSKVG